MFEPHYWAYMIFSLPFFLVIELPLTSVDTLCIICSDFATRQICIVEIKFILKKLKKMENILLKQQERIFMKFGWEIVMSENDL